MDDYIFLFQNLKIVRAGTKIAVVKKNDYLPSHELALAHQLKADSFPRVEIDLRDAVSYLRRDNFTNKDIPKGWNIVRYRDINLGFVNNVGTRVNNYFPVEWRIRLDASALSKAIPLVFLEKNYNLL
jgi:NOL1/NOP2/fmu family ribosome biogenesis protein